MVRNGFTIVELVVIMSIIGILATIATIQFRNVTGKANIESQTKVLYNDLMATRAQALFNKQSRAVVISATQFKAYATEVTSTTPVSTVTLKAPTTAGSGVTVIFDTMGMANVDPAAPVVVCTTEAGSPATVDSVVIEPSRIKMARRNDSGGCTFGNVVIK